MLVGGQVRATLTARDGSSIKLEADDFALQLQHQPKTIYFQMLRVPGDFFDAHRGQPIRATLDYELAIHRPQGIYEMAAERGTLVIPSVGTLRNEYQSVRYLGAITLHAGGTGTDARERRPD